MWRGFYHWLHGKWPAGRVEKRPQTGPHGVTNLPGVRIIGDLSGVPLLKFSSQTGAGAVRHLLAEPEFQKERPTRSEEIPDLAIIGAGVSGVSAALAAQEEGLSYVLYESNRLFHTVENFPARKPIFTYPVEMKPEGGIEYTEKSAMKEGLLAEMHQQVQQAGIEVREADISHVEQRKAEVLIHYVNGRIDRARRVLIAIGQSGNFRSLGVKGQDLPKVMNRLHDPADYAGSKVIVVGGGDSAVEAARSLAQAGAEVTLSYRKAALTRPKEENKEQIEQMAQSGTLDLELDSELQEITAEAVIYTKGGKEHQVENDFVFALIGREAPLDFFRRSGLAIRGERTLKWWVTLFLSALFFLLLYQWKKGGTWLPVNEFFAQNNLFPFGLQAWWHSLGGAFSNPQTLLGTLRYVVGDPGFWYSLSYSLIIVVFGVRRVRRRRTPYVKRQTLTLALIQVIPLFLLPYLLLPWAGFNGAFDEGIGRWIADQLFPVVDYGSGREYWRAFGFILAWPLFFWNVFTEQAMWLWLVISLLQTFVVIPLIVRRWGKGAYCGWICSCGALAETLGDAHRQKMPHGPIWNKLNLIGQVFLALAFALLLFRLLAWVQVPGVKELYHAMLYGQSAGGVVKPWSYVWFVDLLWAGVIGVAFYFHLSGRVWCRFACPLAALMHLYSRFGKFRIFADKKKCISCNVCTSVCHQGIDVMNFANQGVPMADPQCVRCSACVEQCPTGVLQFGRLSEGGNPLLDGLAASSFQLEEQRDRAKPRRERKS